MSPERLRSFEGLLKRQARLDNPNDLSVDNDNDNDNNTNNRDTNISEPIYDINKTGIISGIGESVGDSNGGNNSQSNRNEDEKTFALTGAGLRADDIWACGIMLCHLVLPCCEALPELLRQGLPVAVLPSAGSQLNSPPTDVDTDQEELLSEGKMNKLELLRKCYHGLSPYIQHLIQGLLNPDPALRMSVDQALAHPWVNVPHISPDIPLPPCVSAGQSRRRRAREIVNNVLDLLKSLTGSDAQYCLNNFVKLKKQMVDDVGLPELLSIIQLPPSNSGGISSDRLAGQLKVLAVQLLETIKPGVEVDTDAFTIATCFVSKQYAYNPTQPSSLAQLLYTFKLHTSTTQ